MGLAADGGDGIEGVFDSIVHPVRGRIDLTISTTDPLLPNAGVELDIQGIAREQIDGGEVVLTLPTKALMDHVGAGRPDLPVKARWDLPAIAKGGTWSETFTVPGEAAGYYGVLVNAYTRGPDGGPYLFDDVFRHAWMFISETDGQLTPLFEDAIFPEGIRPVAGPATTDDALDSRPDPDGTNWHRDSVYLDVFYIVSEEGPEPAVGTVVWGQLKKERGYGDLEEARVPEDGIVAFGCPTMPEDRYVSGGGYVPDTWVVEGRGDAVPYWSANNSHCGKKIFVQVRENRYLPWRLLNIAGGRVSEHFQHYRQDPVKWKLNFDSDGGSSYNGILDRITLAWRIAHRPSFLWVVAHEYGHALHHKALGGIWLRSPNCGKHYIDSISSYKCALKEGFADYAGTIGSDGYFRNCFEHFGTPKGSRGFCKNVSHDRKPEIEGWVAAPFMDLIDDREDVADNTEYSGYYVARVFKTCETKSIYLGIIPNWVKRSNVSNIVWCLENSIDPVLHEEVFPGIRTPADVREKATEPPDWSRADIRFTWKKNLK